MAEDAIQQSKQNTVVAPVVSNSQAIAAPKTTPVPTELAENQIKRVSKPLGSSRGTAFSLKNVINNSNEKLEAEDEVLRDDLPRDDYSLEQVQNFWNKFLDRLKIEHSIPAYNALATTTIQLLENNVIQLEFISASSEAEYEIYKSRIMNGLRGAINNFYFTIDVKLSEAEAKSHILTTKQKFEAFVEKNPTILKLKEEFGLDLYE